MSIVALEINQNRILLLAGRKASNRPLEVSHAIEIPLEADLDDSQVSEKLKQIVDEHGLARSETTVVLSRSQSELREIELPPAPDDELPDMVTFKAKSDFASFNDRWLLDFVTLDGNESAPRKVLASAIAPTVSERVEAILEPSGLKLKRMVLRPFSIMELLQGRTSDSVARLVVNPGDDFTDVVVAKGNQTVSTRSIRMSADHSADQRSQQLVSEVRRTLASSKRQLGGVAVSKVILLDDEKANRHLVGNLQERLKIDVDVVDPFDGLSRIGQAKGEIDSPWQFSPLLGSLTHLGSESAPAIDFLNPSRRKEVVVDRTRYWLYGSLAGLVALLTVFFAWWTLRGQAAEIADLEKELDSKRQLNEGDGVRPGVDITLGKTGMIDNWKKDDVNWLDELNAVSEHFLTPDEVIVTSWVASIPKSGPQVEVAGKVVNSNQKRKLFETLESRPFVVTPTRSRSDLQKSKGYPFTFGNLLAVQVDDNAWLKELNKHVGQFNKKVKATPTKEGSAN